MNDRPLNTLRVDDQVAILSGYTHNRIGEGTVVKVCKNWVEVQTPKYARPVRFRTNPDRDLCGVRIVGGLAEYLNDRIQAI
jgi:hypothetical protein